MVATMTHGFTLETKIENNGSQERAYGPHVANGTITITLPENPVGAVFYLEQPFAEKVIRNLIHNFCDLGEGHDGSANDYFRPHMKELVRVEFEERHRVVWRYLIEEPFTD